MTIIDGDEEPVSGATVTIGESTGTTGLDGIVEFSLEYGDYTATIEAEGYVTATEELSFRSNHKNFTVTLTESGGSTGTVTVTPLVDGTPVDFVLALLCDKNEMPTDEDDSMLVANGFSEGQEYTVSLLNYDTTAHQSTDDPNIPFGSYYLFASWEDTDTGDMYSYNGALTVDGDETPTITLTITEGD